MSIHRIERRSGICGVCGAKGHFDIYDTDLAGSGLVCPDCVAVLATAENTLLSEGLKAPEIQLKEANP